jgi:hypothetical protein
VFRGSEATARSIVEHGQCSPTVSGLQSKKQRACLLDVLLSARDWARLGLLFLQWQDQRLPPEGWVAYSLTPTKEAPDARYGAHVARHDPACNRQVVAVVPSRDLAEAARVARTGMVPGAFFTFRLACLAREGVAEVTAHWNLRCAILPRRPSGPTP